MNFSLDINLNFDRQIVLVSSKKMYSIDFSRWQVGKYFLKEPDSKYFRLAGQEKKFKILSRNLYDNLQLILKLFLKAFLIFQSVQKQVLGQTWP